MRRYAGDDLLALCFLGVFLGSDQWKWSVDSDTFVPGMGRGGIVQYS